MIRRHTITCSVLLSALLLGCVALFSCGGEPPIINDDEPSVSSRIKSRSVNANRILIEHEETSINGYVERHQWPVKLLPCGARLHEYETGQGSPVQNDDKVTIRYNVRALSGKLLYRDTTDTFIAGRLQPNEGIDAAVLSLRYGSKAHVVLPSSAAYGVVGDGDAIPPRTPVVYTLEICNPQK